MKHDLHFLIQSLKECAVELGHSPSKREYTQWNKGAHHSAVVARFKSWSAGIIAAGLIPNEETQKKKTSPQKLELVDSPEKISEIIETTTQRKIIQLNNYKKILCIPDSHFPWVDKNALSMIYYIAETEKPDIIVQLGDLFDCYAQSKFPKSLNLFTPKAEWDLARAMSDDMWKTLKEKCPAAECFQLMGNHNVRPLLRMNEKFPEGAHLIAESVKKSFTFDGVTTIHDPTEELFIENIMFIHGHYTGALNKHMEFSRMSVVHGHTHRGSIVYKPYWDQNKNHVTLWEMDCGYIGDPQSIPLSFRAQKIHHWVSGCGLITRLGPMFIPF